MQYWFLDNTKAKRYIAGREGAEPTFIKWSIQNIFDWETYKSNPRLAEVIRNKHMSMHISILVPTDTKLILTFPFGMLQQWIEDGPWDEPKQKTIDLDEDIVDLDDDDEDVTAPTFSQWVKKTQIPFFFVFILVQL